MKCCITWWIEVIWPFLVYDANAFVVRYILAITFHVHVTYLRNIECGNVRYAIVNQTPYSHNTNTYSKA